MLGSAPVVGNGRAVAFRNCVICADVSSGRTDSISAAVPATSGVEKLVPIEGFTPSEYVEAVGTVVPAFEVLRMGYRHGDPAAVFTQLPIGALIATSGPRFENPALVPMWRSPATVITPGQLPGVST